jgi:hypothetical protein
MSSCDGPSGVLPSSSITSSLLPASGNIQGTFREHSVKIQGTLRER